MYKHFVDGKFNGQDPEKPSKQNRKLCQVFPKYMFITLHYDVPVVRNPVEDSATIRSRAIKIAKSNFE